MTFTGRLGRSALEDHELAPDERRRLQEDTEMKQGRRGVTGGLLLLGFASTAAAGEAVLVVPGVGSGLTPASVSARYAATPVTGALPRIAVIATSDVSVPDVASFRNRHGLPPVVIDRAGSVSASSADPSMTILMEWAGVLAPKAPLIAIVGDPWLGLAEAILDNVAPVLVVPVIDASPPDATARILVRILYDRHVVAVGRLDVEVPGPVVAEVLLGLAAARGQTIVVPAGSSLAGQSALSVGGTALRGSTEVVWDDAAGSTDSGADVAALASPIAPGYAYEWVGTPRCCAGGTGVAAALWGGLAAVLVDSSHGAISPRALILDAGRRQGTGGIVAFTDITEGVPPSPSTGIMFTPPSPAYDSLTGFGSPLVAGLVAALACVNSDCDSAFESAAACGRDVCKEGGVCERVALADGTPCARDACTVGTSCQAGVCVGGSALSCDDGSACTTDTCDPNNGCTHAPVPDGATCQLLQGAAGRRDCSPDWLAEAEPGLIRARYLACRDGDGACDHDNVVGQCTIQLSVCVPSSGDCPRVPLRTLQPSRQKARRSSAAAAVRRAVAGVLASLAPGECTAAAALSVPAGKHVTLRIGSARQRSRAITVLCRAVPGAE
jgi:hypothetical protein